MRNSAYRLFRKMKQKFVRSVDIWIFYKDITGISSTRYLNIIFLHLELSCSKTFFLYSSADCYAVWRLAFNCHLSILKNLKRPVLCPLRTLMLFHGRCDQRLYRSLQKKERNILLLNVKCQICQTLIILNKINNLVYV